MRNDLKIGLGVGGLLLVILIAYAIVQKNSSNTRVADGSQPGAVDGQSGRDGPSAGAAEDGKSKAPDGTDAGTNGKSNGLAVSERGDGGDSHVSTPVTDIIPSEPAGTPKPETAAGRDGGIGDGHTGQVRLGDGSSATGQPAQPADGQERWSKILHDDVPPLMSSTPAPDSKLVSGPGASHDTRHSTDKHPGGMELASADPGHSSAYQSSPASPAVAPATQPKPGDRTHVMRAGETFSSIARDVYGDARQYLLIVKANPDVDPARIRPNTVIQLPDPVQVKATVAPAAKEQVVTDPAKEYKVQPGDSLFKISMKCYGRGDKAEDIYEANKALIGADPHKLKLNIVLKLPEPPTVPR